MKNYQEEIEKMSFEQALAELEKIVVKLESGKENLDDAINDYEYGTALREYCEKKLNEAKFKVESLMKNSDGTIISSSFDA